MQMNANKSSDVLSADDLKSHLYQSLHSSGLLKQLKVRTIGYCI